LAAKIAEMIGLLRSSEDGENIAPKRSTNISSNNSLAAEMNKLNLNSTQRSARSAPTCDDLEQCFDMAIHVLDIMNLKDQRKRGDVDLQLLCVAEGRFKRASSLDWSELFLRRGHIWIRRDGYTSIPFQLQVNDLVDAADEDGNFVCPDCWEKNRRR
jgi:hypothetical protein